jgi:hypothetical protein
MRRMGSSSSSSSCRDLHGDRSIPLLLLLLLLSYYYYYNYYYYYYYKSWLMTGQWWPSFSLR